MIVIILFAAKTTTARVLVARARPAAMADYNSRASGEELGDEDRPTSATLSIWTSLKAGESL